MKELRLSNADWRTRRKLLGWIVDSVPSLISLPAAHHEKI
jgi:hypothetical protein